MTRVAAVFVALSTGFSAAAFAAQAGDQSSSAAITVNDARTPESPAFVLLGVSSTQIERPTTPRALALSVASASLNADNLFPQNYALQAAPYWLRGHPGLTSDEYYHPSVVQSILQQLTVSAATARVSTTGGGKTKNATEFGVGVYTAIFAGHAGPDVRRLIARIHAIQLELLAAQFALEQHLPKPAEGPPTDPTYQAIVDAVTKTFDATQASAPSREQEQAYAAARKRLIARVTEMWNDAHRDPAVSALTSAAAELVATIERDLAKAVAAVRRADEARRGFQLAIAGASAWSFPDSGVADRSLSRWGIWATPSYRPDAWPLELIAVVRALRPFPRSDTVVDVGGRVTQQTSVLNWSAEYVARRNGSDGGARGVTERAAAVLEVRAHDDAYVTATFGKDFADRVTGKESGSFFTTLGLVLGFGEKPTIAVR